MIETSRDEDDRPLNEPTYLAKRGNSILPNTPSLQYSISSFFSALADQRISRAPGAAT